MGPCQAGAPVAQQPLPLPSSPLISIRWSCDACCALVDGWPAAARAGGGAAVARAENGRRTGFLQRTVRHRVHAAHRRPGTAAGADGGQWADPAATGRGGHPVAGAAGRGVAGAIGQRALCGELGRRRHLQRVCGEGRTGGGAEGLCAVDAGGAETAAGAFAAQQRAAAGRPGGHPVRLGHAGRNQAARPFPPGTRQAAEAGVQAMASASPGEAMLEQASTPPGDTALPR